MPIQKIPVWSESFRQVNLLALKPQEILPEGFVGAVVAEAFAQDQAEIFIGGDEVAVEGGVLGGRQVGLGRGAGSRCGCDLIDFTLESGPSIPPRRLGRYGR